MKIGITSVNYIKAGDNPVVVVKGRDKNNKSHLAYYYDGIPDFYVLRKDADKLRGHHRVRYIEDDYPIPSIYGEKVAKVSTWLPEDVKKLRREVGITRHFQGDVLFPYKIMIENGWKAFIDTETWKECKPFKFKRRIAYLDIEVISLNGDDSMPSWKNPVHPVSLICIIDNYTNNFYTFYYLPWLREDYVEKREVWTTRIPRRRRVRNLKDYPEKSKWITYAYNNEYEMFYKFLDKWKELDFDIATGWNSSGGYPRNDKRNFRAGFDFPYLIKRLEYLGIDYSDLSPVRDLYVRNSNGSCVIKGLQLFDMMYGYDYFLMKRPDGGLGLDYTSGQKLGIGKVKHKGRVSQLIKQHPYEGRLYNAADTENVMGIDLVEDIINRCIEACQEDGVLLEDTLLNSRVHYYNILRLTKGRYIIPSRDYGKKYKKFSGAMVVEPKVGVWNWVVKIDLNKLYPYSHFTLNASPETKFRGLELLKLILFANGKLTRSPNRVYFYKEPTALVTEIYSRYINKRKKYKNIYIKKSKELGSDHEETKFWYNKQYMVKPRTNSLYGSLGMPSFPLYDRSIAEAITSTGRKILRHTYKIISELGYNIIYGDTDSIMFESGVDNLEEALAIGKEACRIINDSYDTIRKELFADKHWFNIDVEAVCPKFLIAPKKGEDEGAKKRYVYWALWEDDVYCNKIEVVGFGGIRSDRPKFGKLVQKKLFKLILKEGNEKRIIRFIRRACGVLPYLRPVDIGVPSSMTKDVEKYKVTRPVLRAIRYSNKFMSQNFGAGSKPLVFYVKRVNRPYPPTDVFALSRWEIRLPTQFEIDWDKMEEKNIWELCETVLEVVKIDRQRIKQGLKIQENAAWIL